MNKISNIISMPVISLYEGKYIGIVYNISFDYKQKKCKYVCILNEQDNIIQVIKCSDIYTIGKDSIVIKNTSCLELKENCDKHFEENNNPINYRAYNIAGNLIGTIVDIVIDNLYNIINIILDNGESINSEKIINIGNLFLISDEKIRITKFKPVDKPCKNIKVDNDNKVMILNISKPNTSSRTNKIITDFRFLVGRILSKDIIALNGELIAKNGTVVTKDIVSLASQYGKLVEVARYSDKKI